MKKLLFFAFGIAISSATFAQTYNNGLFSTGDTANNGTVAPAGFTWSEVQNNAGNTTESNSTSGIAAANNSGFFVADDFTVIPGEKWTISSIRFFIYRTGYTGTVTPFNIIRVNILNGNPSIPTSTSVFGDDTTNRFASATNTSTYRIFNSTVPNTLNPPGTTRAIWGVDATVATTLNPGTYWVKYQFDDGLLSAGFAPTVTIKGNRGLPTFNAVQFANAAWGPLIDGGTPATAPDYTIDLPFIITYTATSLGTVETRQMDNRVRVYPNPTSDYFKLQLPDDIEKQSISVQLFDMSGKMVKEFKVADQYDISSLAKGTYMIKVKDGSTIKATKVVKN